MREEKIREWCIDRVFHEGKSLEQVIEEAKKLEEYIIGDGRLGGDYNDTKYPYVTGTGTITPSVKNRKTF